MITHVWELALAGLNGLWDHPFRTFLTALGIIFGTAAVIAMVAIGAGAEREALEELNRFGVNSIRINAKVVEGERLKEALKKLARGLALSDVEFLKQACPFLELVVAEKTYEEKLYCLGRKSGGTVVGVGDDFFAAARFELERGRFFSALEQQNALPVTILGHGVASEVFGNVNPLGKVVQIGRTRCEVIGTTQSRERSKGKLAIKSRDHDQDVYLPLSVTTSRFFKWPVEDRELYHEVSSLWLTVKPGFSLTKARDLVMAMLKRRHRDMDDVEALVPLEILQQSQKTQEIFNLVMALIAGISLLVGGIGIMNIMLATVNERTREIGIRRALGATRRDIVVQFLTESTMISLLGGLAGIGVGIGLARLIAYYTAWTVVIPISAGVVAFGVSLGVGVVFGLFPAYKAAQLDPITALRYE